MSRHPADAASAKCLPPSVHPTEALVKALVEVGRREYADSLERSYDALRIVVGYVESSHGMESLEASIPLRALINALSDTLRGGRPELLQPRRRGKGAPKDQSFSLVQGAIAGALETLVRVGISPDSGARYVADQAHSKGVCDREGERITHKQVKAWRNRANDDLASAGSAVFKDVLRLSVPDQAAAKLRVQGVLRSLANSALGPEKIPEKG